MKFKIELFLEEHRVLFGFHLTGISNGWIDLTLVLNHSLLVLVLDRFHFFSCWLIVNLLFNKHNLIYVFNSFSYHSLND
jgi:hypothetical protein